MPSASLVKEFENLIGKENVFTSEADRQSYAYDAAVLPSVVPGLVLRPTTTEQLGSLIERCYANGLPMTVRGAGTNLSGGTVPDADKSVVILTQGLNKIIEINEEDLYAVVEPGVVTAQFAAAVAAKGLFYPPDPGSMAVSTLGGNIAENAGGLRGLKYGVTKDYVMGLEFYDNNGELVKTGSRTVKCVTGYNLGGLMVASEGTLGMISKAILKLVPPPQASKAMMAVFDDVQKASEAVSRIIAARILPCTLEFMDNMTINLVEDDVRISRPAKRRPSCSSKWTGTPDRSRTRRRSSRNSSRRAARSRSRSPRTPPKRTKSGKPAARPFPRWPASSRPPSLKTPPSPAPRFPRWSSSSTPSP